MSFLSNKFKFETKSSETHIANFVSCKSTASIIMTPDNINNEGTLFGANNFSNIEAFIGITSNGTMNTIAGFNECNINFYTDTVVRGNLIVDGSIMSLGLDVVLESTDLHIETYNNYKNIGSNVIVNKYKELTNSYLSSTSNNISLLINNSFSNIYNLANNILNSNYQDPSQIISSGNAYDDTQFSVYFQKKSADDIREQNNKYIVNGTYDYQKLIIKGDLKASNIIIYDDIKVSSNIVSSAYSGDGTFLKNILIGDGTTNSLIEGSNIFYNNQYVIDIVDNSNIHTSNYINKVSNNIQSNILTNDDNINDTSNLLYNTLNNSINNLSNYSCNIYENTMDIIKILYNNSSNDNIFKYNISNILEEKSLHFYDNYNNSSNEILTNTEIYNNDVERYLINTSNITAEIINITNIKTSNDIDNISTFITQNIYDTYSNLSNIIMDDNSLSNKINNMRTNILDYINISYNTNITNNNIIHNINSNNVSNLFNNKKNLLEEYTSGLSNIIIYTSNTLYNILANNNVNTSNYIDSVFSSNITLLNNNIDNSYNDIINVSNFIQDTYNNIDDIINNSNIKNYANNTSNDILKVVFNNIQKQKDISTTILEETNNNILENIQHIDTNIIKEGSSNFYYTADKFNEYFNNINYDKLNNGTSNKFIVNNVYNSNLYINGILYTSNLKILNNFSTINTDVYQCGSSIILSSNNVNLLVSQITDNITNNILGLYDYNSNIVFVVKNSGKTCVNNLNPVYDFDVYGDAKCEFFIGNACGITDINLEDKRTIHVREGSNLYYNNARIGELLLSSNSLMSNYISSLSNDLFQDTNIIMNQSNDISIIYTDFQNSLAYSNINISNYILNISNIYINTIQKNTEDISNYVFNISNNINIKLNSSIINNSNYIILTSNILIDKLNTNYINISNYNTILNSNLTNNINYSNINTSNNISIILDNGLNNRINIYDINQSNHITQTSNLLLGNIQNRNYNISNYTNNINSNIVSGLNILDLNIKNYITNTSNSLIKYYSNIISSSYLIAGNSDVITDIYGGDKILHINFSNVKSINNIDNANFKLLNRSVITNNPIYPTINTLTTANNIISGYQNSNINYLNSSNNIYVYNNNDADCKTVLDKLNNGFLIHFLFKTRYTQNTPIFFNGNNLLSFINIKVLYGLLYIKLGYNTTSINVFVNNIIIPNIWYVVDIAVFIINGEITFKVYYNRILQNITLSTPTYTSQKALIQTTTYNNNLNYIGGQNLTMMFGCSNLLDTYDENYNYVSGATYTNTYFSSNSYIKPGVLSPIIRNSAYNYSSYSNLIFSSYYASNFDYQYSSNISSANVILSTFTDNADSRLIIGDITVTNLNFVLTEIETNVRLSAGYYIFMLDLQNEVTCDLLIGKQNDTNIDNYFNVANYYNSNLLNVPSSSITNVSNMVLDTSLYIPEGYYRFYMRMLRQINDRNNKYFIAKYYNTNTWTGTNYTLNDSNISVKYINYSSLNTTYKSGSSYINNLFIINNNIITATSNLYTYSVTSVIESGYVYSCGYNTYGQLGIGSTVTYQPSLQQVLVGSSGQIGTTVITNISQISGTFHSLFLHTSGEVYSCGANNFGQLGIGSTSPTTAPETSLKRVLNGLSGQTGTYITGITKISCGSYHSLFLHSSGEVYSCGLNNNGQLGIGPTIEQPSLQRVLVGSSGQTGTTVITNITQISAGESFSLFLHTSSGVYSCGQNTAGQLGIGSVASPQTLLQRVLVGSSGLTGTYISGIKQISCNGNYSLFLHTSGEVYSCGDNNCGQLGTGSTTPYQFTSLQRVLIGSSGQTGTYISNIKQICAGYWHSLFLHNTGIVYSCGRNHFGQLGIDSIIDKSSLQRVLVGSSGQTGTTVITNISQISASQYHSLFLHSSGEVYSCGYNDFGQLGINSTVTPQTSLQRVLVGSSGQTGTYITNIKQIYAANHSLFISNGIAKTITNISNYNYNISHLNIGTFFSGNRDISSNLLNIQDFKILNNPISLATDYSISNILYIGKDNCNITYTSSIYTNRWSESENYSNLTNKYIYYDEGNVSIGSIAPSLATLEINTNIVSDYKNVLINSIKTNNGIWTNLGVITSSDERIKKNINDISDDVALKQILSITPKSYNYIDNTKNNIYGFIAQEVKNIIPTAITLHTDAIPNIYKTGTIEGNIITLEANNILIEKLESGAKILIIDANNNRYEEIVKKVIYDNNIKIEIENVNNIIEKSIFIYGVIVNDFHTIDKSYIYTLNVCALQEIYRRHLRLREEIGIFKEYDSVMPSKISLLTSNILELEKDILKINIDLLNNKQRILLDDILILKGTIKTLIENIASYDIAEIDNLNSNMINIQAINKELVSSNINLVREYDTITNTIRNYTNELMTIKSILQMNNIMM